MVASEILITPLVASIVGFGVWYLQSRINRIQKAQERLLDERRQIYVETLSPIVRTLAGVKNPRELEKAQKQMISFEYRLKALEFNLLGSDDVVKSFNALMQHIYNAGNTGAEDPKELMRLWGGLILEIRKNVGDPKTKLTDVDMLKAQITDIENVLGTSA